MGVIDPYGRAGTLLDRVETPEGLTRETAIARGEGAIRALHDDYRRKLREDVDRLEDAVKADQPGEILAHALEIKGLAGTFGYDLADRIAGSLCEYLLSCNARDKRRATVLEAHLEGLRCVVTQDVQGHGNKQQQTLAATLIQLANVGRAS